MFLQEFSTKISAKNMMSRGQLSEFERFSQENDVLSQDKVSLTSSSLKTRISGTCKHFGFLYAFLYIPSLRAHVEVKCNILLNF